MELKPYPFCGERPHFHSDIGRMGISIGCDSYICAVQPVTRWCNTAEEAIEARNRRVGDKDGDR